jgi:Flp pilus assembly protein TadB
MKDFEAIKRLWQVQPTEPISIEDVFTRINEEKRGYAHKLLKQTIIVAIALLTMFMIWLTATFVTWTSHLAVVIVMGCLIYYFCIQLEDYLKINKTAFIFKKPDEYITYLKEYKRSRFKLNTESYQVYVIFIGISLALFAFEMYYILPLSLLIFYLVMSIGWILICQFVFMKQFNRKEEKRLETIINDLERLSKQFNT